MFPESFDYFSRHELQLVGLPAAFRRRYVWQFYGVGVCRLECDRAKQNNNNRLTSFTFMIDSPQAKNVNMNEMLELYNTGLVG